VQDNDKPVTNPLVVLREEFDDWAVLFDPDTGNACGLNPIGVFIWKRLDGKHSMGDILQDLPIHFEDVPAEAREQINEFLQTLIEQGFAKV